VYTQLDGYTSNTNTFIQQIRDRFASVNVLGFRIMPGSSLSRFVSNYGDQEFYEEVQKQWRKQKSAIIPSPIAFTALYAINSSSLNDDVEFEVESGAKKADISRAFKKMLKGKSTNKKLLSSFIQHVA
jgi:NADP-dependent 3-hydroxy acid dehydrogenase YdfG